MRDRLIEIFKKINYKPFEQCNIDANLATQFTEYALNHIVDELLANGVIVPPCKVGDVVYMVTPNGNIRNLNILEIDIELEEKESKTTCLAVYDLDGTPCHIQIQSSKFGKTVFRTREEAVAKLKGDKIAIQ